MISTFGGSECKTQYDHSRHIYLIQKISLRSLRLTTLLWKKTKVKHPTTSVVAKTRRRPLEYPFYFVINFKLAKNKQRIFTQILVCVVIDPWNRLIKKQISLQPSKSKMMFLACCRGHSSNSTSLHHQTPSQPALPQHKPSLKKYDANSSPRSCRPHPNPQTVAG